MDVGIDRAGEDQLARQIHHLSGGRGIPGRAGPGHPAIADAEGGGAGAAAENVRATDEEQVEGRVSRALGHHAHSFMEVIV